MGTEVGAQLAGVPPTNLAMFFGYNIPGEEHDGKPLYRTSWEGSCPHAVWVNRAGQRFCDESFYKEFQPAVRSWDGLRQERPNYPPFLIFDQNYRDRYPLGSYMPGQPLPDGMVEIADTLAELGARLGIDGAALEASVARFNGLCEEGVDRDFGKGTYPWSIRMFGDEAYKNPNMGPLNRPPYHGLKLVPVGVGINSHGLKTNRDAQVVHVRGHAIPGLYAVGNAAALLDLGAGYQSGTSNARAITWGYRAARHVMAAS
jgi:3-oxosteroid 1-dehydrogenase